jgi:hypothetical protein
MSLNESTDIQINYNKMLTDQTYHDELRKLDKSVYVELIHDTLENITANELMFINYLQNYSTYSNQDSNQYIKIEKLKANIKQIFGDTLNFDAKFFNQCLDVIKKNDIQSKFLIECVINIEWHNISFFDCFNKLSTTSNLLEIFTMIYPDQPPNFIKDFLPSYSSSYYGYYKNLSRISTYSFVPKNFNDYKHLFKYSSDENFVDYFQPDLECLINACNIRDNINIIKLLIEEKGITPNEESLKNASCLTNNKKIVRYILEYVKPTQSIITAANLVTSNQYIVNILVGKSDNKPTLEGLEDLCSKTGNVTAIKSLVTKHKIKPNTQCLYNACCSYNNKSTVDYLIKQGAIPDKKCFKMALGHTKKSSVLTALLEGSYPDMFT